MGNKELWESTALFVTYDEHDGYFDHVLPPAPEATVTDEYIDGLPIGFGSRVPMIIASPRVHGPDGFLTSFAGAVVPAGQNSGQAPRVAATQVATPRPVLRLVLANDGWQEVTFTLTPNEYADRTRTVSVAAGHPVVVDWAAGQDGYYDVTVTASTTDGFTRRYAGRIA